MIVPNNAKIILDGLKNSGYEAYLVGGCVRDFLLDRDVFDYDICTSARPEEVQKVFSSYHVVPTGLKHGTVSVIINGDSFEVTTFRTDGKYIDNRHPNNVSFVTSLEEDLKRRDFTMNSIAFSEDYVDIFGGIDDINNKTIKCVGYPDKRFKEDALRIMRGIRFAATFGFKIEENTKKAIFKNKELLKNVSSERLFSELSKLLMGDFIFNVLNEYRNVIAVIVPEIVDTFDYPQNTKWHIFDVYTHIAKSVEVCPKNVALRLTMLLHDIGKPFCKITDDMGVDHFKGHPKLSAEMTSNILKRFKVSNEIYNKVYNLVLIHDRHIYNNKKSVKHWLMQLGSEDIFYFLDVKKADLLAQNPKYTSEEIEELEKIKQLVIEVIESGECYSISSLAVNGFDLINLGYKGEQIGEKLNYLLELVINDEVKNDKKELLKIIENKNN